MCCKLIFSFLLAISFFVTNLNAQSLKKDSVSIDYKYLVHIPKDTPESGKFPLILFLHGAGSRGDDINMVGTHNPLKHYPNKGDFPFLLVAPQCPAGKSWNPDILLNILAELEKKYPIDLNKEYITGLSLGGKGVWDLLQKAPDKFAAAAPVCGWGDSANLCLLKYTPVWAFHGKEDQAVLPQQSIGMITALNNAGGHGKIKLYDHTKHNSWDSAYAEPKLYEWLLKHSRIGEELPLSADQQSTYEGEYLFEKDGKRFPTFIVNEHDHLWYSVPYYNFKVRMYKVQEDLFRLENIPLAGDSELFFTRDSNGNINGHQYFPCDKTFVPKVK